MSQAILPSQMGIESQGVQAQFFRLSFGSGFD
jgi:hypothetical protein